MSKDYHGSFNSRPNHNQEPQLKFTVGIPPNLIYTYLLEAVVAEDPIRELTLQKMEETVLLF